MSNEVGFEDHNTTYPYIAGILLAATDGAADDIAVLLRIWPEEITAHVRDRLLKVAEDLRKANRRARDIQEGKIVLTRDANFGLVEHDVKQN